MRSLQTPILNKLQPGKVPIFIVAPNRADGDALAHLISTNVRRTGISGADNLNAVQKKNLFLDTGARHLLPVSFEEKKKKEQRESVKLVLTQGFENSTLWGLQLDYELFFGLNIAEMFPYASFIFLYGTRQHKITTENKESDHLIGILDTLQKYAANSVLLHQLNVLYAENVVLRSLPFATEYTVVEKAARKEIVVHEVKTNSLISADNFELYGLKQQLDEHNYLKTSDAWFSGKLVKCILYARDSYSNDVLLNKLFQYSFSFFPAAELHIIADDVSVAGRIEAIIAGYTSILPSVTLSVASEKDVVSSLNEIINASGATYILVDDLILTFSSTDVFLQLKRFSAPACIFGALDTEKSSSPDQQLDLVDILSLDAIPGNLLFRKENWLDLKGLDESFDVRFSLWDFAIRLLEIDGNYAGTVQAITHSAALQYELADREEQDARYAKLIAKHKHVFASNLELLLAGATENKQLPKEEIVNLNYKIVNLQSMVSHSRDEVRAINEQKGVLQNQINLMESRWYFKLARKINHFRRIFFKEKSSGGRGILKAIKFFFFAFTKPGFRVLRKVIKAVLKKMYVIAEDRPVRIVYLDEQAETTSGELPPDNYHDWIMRKLEPGVLRKRYEQERKDISTSPTVSIIMPVYNPRPEYLKQAIESVTNQLYPSVELCIADDCSTDPLVIRLLESYSFKDPRIKVVFRKENGHISAASNSALDLVTGDFVLCLDHDDVLAPHAVWEIVKFLDKHPNADIVYSDEDKINDQGVHSNPYFKPDWAPDSFLAKNYVNHITAYRKSLLDEVGGYRLGFEGSQDYDLMLRASEKARYIGHIPKVLYHWRMHELSAAQSEGVKPYAFIAARKAIEEAMQRRGIEAEVQYLQGLMGYRVKYAVEKAARVSILIPTKDQAKLMKNTIDSLIAYTDYPDFEILVLDNNSNTEEFFSLMNEYKEKYSSIFRCIEAKFPFNFARLMNFGAEQTTGEYILMLNNDVQITHADWLTTMVSFAQQKRIGAVGVKLLYPDDTIQHAGTVIGLGGVAGHVFVHQYKDDPGYFYYLQSVTNYSAVTAACLMVRRDVYEEVGGMDEKLEVEYNDVDFCLKVLDKGYYNVYTPDVVLYHYESATRGHPHQNKASFERHVREVTYFKEKWNKYIEEDPFYNPNLTLDRQDFSFNYKY